ncbi:hypothetical protein CU254_39580 [Amycolatopsis sp. AA4]|uniref:hypothetical protein n=1 Tax=Actinomycetes TaxID=1760 RepID=UPI0001B57BAD|nr:MULTISPECIES: hypothetical protein [Actinomycetes]ATY15806.1 hypothetical protein CU254_39580 [Amycolatopsis sp. AA4]EFL12124.1 predicted protein [Streptomyces sp. AA4]
MTESDGWLMGLEPSARIEQHFEGDWREPVQVVVLGRVKVGRDRRRERADRSLGCVAESVLEILANLAWPFLALWEFVTVPKRRRKPVAVPSGPARGEAFAVAAGLKGRRGDIAVVRGAARVALVELRDGEPVVVWQGSARWSPSPACLYWEDGSMLMLAPR